MFTRSSPELKPLAPADADSAAVGNDLKIIGQSLKIFSRGTLHRARCAA
jgi:hypothetical protein